MLNNEGNLVKFIGLYLQEMINHREESNDTIRQFPHRKNKNPS